jgi:hypothetical protein
MQDALTLTWRGEVSHATMTRAQGRARRAVRAGAAEALCSFSHSRGRLGWGEKRLACAFQQPSPPHKGRVRDHRLDQRDSGSYNATRG